MVAWRLDKEAHRTTWDSGEGARLVGGRWNNPGTRVVYTSLDPATALLEVAAHSGFGTIDTRPHVLTSMAVTDLARVKIVNPADVPNPNWLRPGPPSAGQRAYGEDLMARHAFVLIPSVLTSCSWNLIFDPSRATGGYVLRSQERFALDTRLNLPPITPPAAPSAPAGAL